MISNLPPLLHADDRNEVPFATITHDQQNDMNAYAVPPNVDDYYSESEGSGDETGRPARRRSGAEIRACVNMADSESDSDATSGDSGAEGDVDRKGKAPVRARASRAGAGRSRAFQRGPKARRGLGSVPSFLYIFVHSNRLRYSREDSLNDVSNVPGSSAVVRTGHKGRKRAHELTEDGSDDDDDQPSSSSPIRATRPSKTHQYQTLVGRKVQNRRQQMKGVHDPRTRRQDEVRSMRSEWEVISFASTIQVFTGYSPCPLSGCEYSFKLTKDKLETHLVRYHAQEFPEAVDYLCRAGANQGAAPATVPCIMGTAETPCSVNSDIKSYGNHLLASHFRPKTYKCTACGEEFFARYNKDATSHLATCRKSGSSSSPSKPSGAPTSPTKSNRRSSSPSKPSSSKRRRLA